MGNKCGAKEADQMIANTEPQKDAEKTNETDANKENAEIQNQTEQQDEDNQNENNLD